MRDYLCTSGAGWLAELCDFASCFRAENGGNPPSLESAKEIVLIHFKITGVNICKEVRIFSFSCCFTKPKRVILDVLV